MPLKDVRELPISQTMERKQHPDDNSRDARKHSEREDHGGSAEEAPPSNEVVPPGDGVVPHPEANAILHLLSWDPVSLRMVLGGGLAIGVILASRVKQLGSVEFFEGMPNGLPELLRVSRELPPS